MTCQLNKVYEGSYEDLQKELSVITLENVKRYKAYKTRWDDFYSMWLRFGPDSARTVLVPYIWDGRLPSPKEARGV
mgnify:CR=1 FL=1|tara:strand:- start:717 stop:944 length:228 start_codon:yes stop_codon:yes gene_type:complete